jgi:hypothetical protein
VPQNVGLTKYINVLFIDKTKVLLGHVSALDCRWCARPHQTTHNFHCAAGEAMARAAQEMGLMSHALDC